MTTIGWLLLIGGIIGVIWVLRARGAAAESAGRANATPPPARSHYAGVLAAVVGGILLIVAGSTASARLAQTHAWDFAQDPHGLISKPDRIQWDGQSGRLKFHLEPDSGAYAVWPVDWDADAFRAEFDVQIDERGDSPRGEGFLSVGLFDGSISSIEDTDHVAGSTIQASFGRDIRLRVSDTNLLSRSDALTLREGAQKGIQLEPGKTYHAILSYTRRLDTATLEVTAPGSSDRLVNLKVEELRDFTPNVAYFGISIKGYKKGKDDKPKPFVTGSLDNVRFLQP